MKNLQIKKLRNAFLILLVFLAVLSAVLTFNFSAAVAEDTTKSSASVSEFYLPETPLEYKELSSPVDVYYSDDLTAIAEDKQLFVYRDGKYIDTSKLTFTTIKQVKRFDNDTLLVSDNGIIYTVNVVTCEKTAKTDSLGNIIGGNYFDISDNYLITTYGTNALVYKINGNVFTKVNTLDSYRVLTDSPIAINKANQVFFVDDSGIRKLVIGSGKTAETVYKSNPDKMIADSDSVYYIEDSKVVRINISDNSKTDLSFSNIDDDYTLGSKITLPKVIAFKGKNLLLTDASSVQEFKIENDELIFTGFAVAGKRSAFNRIGNTATEIEKYGDTVAVLDQFKLTVFKNDGNSDYYSRDNFDNYLAEDLGGSGMPSAFALGNGTALLINQRNISSSSLRFLDLESKKPDENSITLFSGNIIRDVCYQSGYYYVLVSDGNTSFVYKLSEKDKSSEKLNISSLGNGYLGIAVDVFGNVYLNTDTAIYKLNKTNAYGRTTLISTSGTKKLSTDLSGKLFVLNASGLNYFDNGSLVKVYSPTLTTSAITSFAMDFITEEIYFIYEGEELLSKGTNLSNVAISSAVIPENYATTGSNADISKLKVYTAKSGANVYSVTVDDNGFKFSELVKEPSEYLYLCDINVKNGFTLTALAGQEGVVLINKTEIKSQSLTLSDAPATAFVTTDVNAYFLPLITKNAEFSLTEGDTVIRLSKSTAIFPEKIFTHLGREYYFASVTVGGTTYKGYIPVAFTVEVLAENFVWDEFTLKETVSTTVYADKEMTEKLFDISDGQTVRIIAEEQGTYQIGVKSADGTLVVGYIQSSAVKTPENTAVRNVIIIMALAICAFGTTLFLVLKKRR